RLIQRPTKEGTTVATADSTKPGLVPFPTAKAPKDSAPAVVFHTDAGRRLPGGGGIRPDIVVGSDSITESERELAKALGSHIQAYRDILTAYALELKVKGSVKDPAFQVTPVMRAEVLRRLRDKSVVVPDSVWQGSQKLVDEGISYEVTHYVFGKAQEFQRRAADDVQVQSAIDLLRRA